MMHRFKPPLRIGINIASVSSPSSGSWKATLRKVESLKKRPGSARLKPIMTTSSSKLSPTVVLSTLKRSPVPLAFIFSPLVLLNIAGSSCESDIGFFAFFVVRNGDSHYDRHADDNVHEVVGNAHQVEAVL
ncbi:hypothetical protein EDF75_5204 [Raoultella sp. BIGb0149]|nr:hypothetical protein EDF75_5204 [Raoultella sp. BIGb0149]